MAKSKPMLPYRVFEQEHVVPASDGWDMVVEDGVVAKVRDGDPLPGWDAKLKWRLEREFSVTKSANSALGLRETAPFCNLTVVGATSGGWRREVLYSEPLQPGEASDIRVSIAPPSERLAKDLILMSGVYITRPLRTADMLVPARVGSRLWELRERIRLEGGAARLPMYEVSFAQMFPGKRLERAEYHLEYLSESQSDIESSLTVYLNSDRADFVQAVSSSKGDAERRLWSGILRRLITSSLLSDEWPFPRADSASLQATVLRWAGHVWPGIAPSDMPGLLYSDYSLFEAQLDSWLAGLLNARGGLS